MRLRILKFDFVSPLRSQALYHGVAEAMQADDDPVLILCSPNQPYVSIGMHQDAALEIDLEFCRQNQLPVIRRQVGGGTVLLDNRQLFFQFVFPRNKAPRQAETLYPHFIEPAVRTYQQLGIPAEYRAINDIQVAGKKIGGTGAASIGNATIMVGNFLLDFDAQLMAKVVHSPSPAFQEILATVLQSNMVSMRQLLDSPPSFAQLADLFLPQLGDSIHCNPVISELTNKELQAIDEFETELADEEWLSLPGRRFVKNGLKISADTYLIETTDKHAARCIYLQRERHIDTIFFPDLEDTSEITDVLRNVRLTEEDLHAALAKTEYSKKYPSLKHSILQSVVTEAI